MPDPEPVVSDPVDDENAAAGEAKPSVKAPAGGKLAGGSSAPSDGNNDLGLVTDIDENMSVEIEILALAAMRRMAAEAAQRIVEAVEPGSQRRVLIAGEALFSDLGLLDPVAGRLDGLVAALTPEQPSAVTDGATSTGRTIAPSSLGVGWLAENGGELVSLTSQVMQLLRLSSAYSARNVALDDRALHPALAGQLRARGCEVMLPERAAARAAAGEGAAGKLMRAVQALEGLRVAAVRAAPAQAGDGDPAAGEGEGSAIQAAAAAADKLLAELNSPSEDGSVLLGRLLRAAAVSDLLAARPAPLLATTRMLFAGGAYRTRERYVGADRMTCRAGAALAYTVYDAATMAVVVSDVLFHAGPPVALPEAAEAEALTNMPADAARLGFAVLPRVPRLPAT